MFHRALKASALGQPRGIVVVVVGGGSDGKKHVHQWVIHVTCMLKPEQYCKEIILH